jgi:hypothetical protein
MSLLCFSFLTCYRCFVFYDNILNIASSRYCCVGGHELSKTTGGRIACGKHTHSIVNPIFSRHSLYNINKMAVMLKIKVQNIIREILTIQCETLFIYCFVGSNNLTKFEILFTPLKSLIIFKLHV